MSIYTNNTGQKLYEGAGDLLFQQDNCPKRVKNSWKLHLVAKGCSGWTMMQKV